MDIAGHFFLVADRRMYMYVHRMARTGIWAYMYVPTFPRVGGPIGNPWGAIPDDGAAIRL